MALAAEHALDDGRHLLNQFFHGEGPERFIFTLNCTDALNMAFKGVLQPGDHVITTDLEHNSVSRPLRAMELAGYITLTRRCTPTTAAPSIPTPFDKAITPKTRLIAMTHASNVLGTVQPIAEIGQHRPRARAAFPRRCRPDRRRRPDRRAGDAHRPARLPRPQVAARPDRHRRPLRRHHGHRSQRLARRRHRRRFLQRDPAEGLFPYFLEGGTPNVLGVAGLGAAIEYVSAHDPAKTLAHERARSSRSSTRHCQPKFTLYGPKTSANRVGTVTFNIQGYTPQEAGSVLDESFQVAVRPGLHCSPYAHKGIGTFPDGAIRVSPGHFNTDEELASLLDALTQIAA